MPKARLTARCHVAGYFDAPGAPICPLVGPKQHGITLPPVSLVFCSIDNWAAMKVPPDSRTHSCQSHLLAGNAPLAIKCFRSAYLINRFAVLGTVLMPLNMDDSLCSRTV